MRNTVVTLLTASMLVAAAMVGMPNTAQSQVIIIVGNGNGQPYYPPPYPHPHPYPYPYHHHVVYGGYGYYPPAYPYPYHHPVVYGGYYPEYGDYNGDDYYAPY